MSRKCSIAIHSGSHFVASCSVWVHCPLAAMYHMYSNCSSQECYDYRLNDSKEGHILIPQCTFNEPPSGMLETNSSLIAGAQLDFLVDVITTVSSAAIL